MTELLKTSEDDLKNEIRSRDIVINKIITESMKLQSRIDRIEKLLKENNLAAFEENKKVKYLFDNKVV